MGLQEPRDRSVVSVAMNTAEIRVGRLVEVRVDAGYRSAADVHALFAAIKATLAGRPEKRFVTVVDWRRCPVMSSEAAQCALEEMTRSNPRVERSAALTSPHSPTAVLQFLRLVRESNNDDRQLFRDPDALVAWLAEVLLPEEAARARQFLEVGAERTTLPVQSTAGYAAAAARGRAGDAGGPGPTTGRRTPGKTA
jgi:hypothetical protein